jgi:hypothetical protein
MNKKLLNPFFPGVDVIQDVPNADIIKHPITISEFKGLRTQEQMTSSKQKRIFAVNVLNDENGDGHLFSLTSKSLKTNELVIDYFKRGETATENERLMNNIVSVMKELQNGIVCTFTETACFSTSIVKLMLEIDGGKTYSNEQIEERLILMEKGITTEPIFEIKTKRYTISLISKMAGTYKFKFQKNGNKPQTVIVFNLSGLFNKDLEEGYLKLKNEKDFTFKRVMDKVNFSQFHNEYLTSLKVSEYGMQGSEYVSDVFKKLGHESFATYILMERVSLMFARKNGSFLSTIYSAGNLLEQSLACELSFVEREEISSKKMVDDLISTNGAENTIKALHLSTQSYSGGKIELYNHGNVSQGKYSDVSSSFPSVMSKGLYKIDEHTKIIIPELTKTSKIEDFEPQFGEYVFVQAMVYASGQEKHSLLSKKAGDNSFAKSPKQEKGNKKTIVKKADRTNVNPMGYFESSDLWEAFKFFEEGKDNKIMKIQKVIIIKTRGEKHHFSLLSEKWFEDRMLDKKNEFLIKLILNSMYGKLFEGFPQYEIIDGEITFTGFKVGSYFNPILASVITSFARIVLTTAERVIEKNGGTMINCVVDSLAYTIKFREKKKVVGLTEHQKMLKETLQKRIAKFGTEGTLYGEKFPSWFYEQEEPLEMDELLPESFPCILEKNYGIVGGWSKDKKLGYFSKPETFTNGFFVDVGSYEYKMNGQFVFKTMGYRLPKPENKQDEDFRNEHGFFKWGYVKSMMLEKKLKLNNSSADGTFGFQFEYPILASIGYMLSRDKIDVSILGQSSNLVWTISPKGSFIDSDKKRNPNVELAIYDLDFEENLRFNFVFCNDYEDVLPSTASSTLHEYEKLCEVTEEEKQNIDILEFYKRIPLWKQRQKVYKRILGIDISSRDTTRQDTIRKMGEKKCLEMVIEQNKIHCLFE